MVDEGAIAEEIEVLAGYGVALADVATLTGLTAIEIAERFSDRWARGVARAKARVAEAAYLQASSGRNFQATAFWLRNRAGWLDAAKTGGASEPEPQLVAPADLADVACLATVRRTRAR